MGSLSRRLRFLVILCIPAGAAMAAPAAVVSCATPGPLTIALGAAEVAWSGSIEGNGETWLEVAESGQNLEVAVIPAELERLEVQSPARYGRTLLRFSTDSRVEARRVQAGSAVGAIELQLHCTTSSTFERHLEWMRSIQPELAQLHKAMPKDAIEPVLARLRIAQGSASDAIDRALADHLLAEALLINGRSAAAVAEFTQAEQSWLQAGRVQEALAARVGRVENLLRSGAHSEALKLASALPSAAGAGSYFAVRLGNSRCMALAYLAHREPAATCWKKSADRFDALDERTEWANTIYNLAAMYQELGRSKEAERLARDSLQRISGPGASLVRGRLQLLMAGIAMQRADMANALGHYDIALDEFSQAGVARWDANARLKLAELYADLGAFDDAYGALGEALSRLSPRDAPARVAYALMTLATLDRQDRRPESAARWAEDAQQIFTALDMPAEREAADLLRLRLQLERKDFVAARETSERALAATRFSPVETAMLGAELALARGDTKDAATHLASMRRATLSLPQRISLAALESRFTKLTGDAYAAEQELRVALERVLDLAARSDSRLLRHLLERRVDPLRREALALLLGDATGDVPRERIAGIWFWLVAGRNDAPGALRAAGEHADASRQDAALAAELLPSITPPAHVDAQREMLATLGSGSPRLAPGEQRGKKNVAVDEQALSTLQRSLPEDTVLLAHVDSGAGVRLLWITAHAAWLSSSADARQLRGEAGELRRLLQSPLTPLVAIENRARSLSAALWPGTSTHAVPRHLLVLSSETLDAMPWPVLYWPGSSERLLETTAVSVISPGRPRVHDVQNAPASIDIFIAAQQSGYAQGLPVLVGAAEEAARITSTVSPRSTLAHDGGDVTRAAILDALQKPGGWLHVAAHGVAQAGRIGYSGIWLEPEAAGAAPPFLSWFDVLDRGVAADLVVLNACQLGDERDLTRGNFGFAAATIEAGAANVVAALWPVSDSAAGLWVPALYAALPERGGGVSDVAQAVRAAQLRLLTSRAFRHPFYWASLRHLARMPSE